MNRRDAEEPVYSITGTRRGLSEDVSARTRRYALTMGIRTVCFLLAVLTTGWLRWTFMAGALLLPYFAVVIANGGREQAGQEPAEVLGTSVRPAVTGPPPGARPHDDAA